MADKKGRKCLGRETFSTLPRRRDSELNLAGVPEFFASGIPDYINHGLFLSDFVHHVSTIATNFASNVFVASTGDDALLDSSMSMAVERRMSESAFLDSLGHDLLVFLVTTVVVVPLSRFLGVTPVLGFLVAGFLLGPFGMHVFSNTETDIELGDFGILFLLFAEGLNLSPGRIKKLGAFGTLGVIQLLASMGILFVGLLAVGPYVLQNAPSVFQLDKEFLSLFESPAECFCLAAAGALSSSAFVLPILKEKGWEDRPEGIAALSVLLLQDLAVAPLLVIFPLVAGAGPQSSAEFGFLLAKGTLGFGAVLYVGSVLLKYIFDVVAAARSTETFVAAALLVAVGMGGAADLLGLSATTGAFAAGVLLANNKYRAQIKADVQPFEGLLLGIFFVTAGASLDPTVIANDFPTVMFGITTFIIVKALVLFLAGPIMGRSRSQASRVAITLAGGGEFSLVLLKLARELGLIPNQLCKVLLASVIISMSLTPLLGEAAAIVSNLLEKYEDVIDDPEQMDKIGLKRNIAGELFDSIDTDNSGSIDYDELRAALLKRGLSPSSVAEIFDSFDDDGSGCISRKEWEAGMASGFLAKAISYEPGALVEMKELDVKVAPDAIVICGFTEFGRGMYKLLEAAGCAENGGLVAFDLNPSRVAAGLLAGVNIVYGNGASAELLRAAGVKRPKGLIVTYRNEARRLEATARLREFLPEGTPIYSREVSGQTVTRNDLLEAGATEVVCERSESALRFATLLGVLEESNDMSKYRKIVTGIDISLPEEFAPDPEPIPGIPELRFESLCEEFECSRDELIGLYNIFSSLPDTDGDKYVQIEELEDVYLRRASNPVNDDEAQTWLEKANNDGGGKLSFVDFARLYYASEGVKTK